MDMKFVKGLVIGGLVTTGMVMLWQNDNMFNTNKMMKKGPQNCGGLSISSGQPTRLPRAKASCRFRCLRLHRTQDARRSSAERRFENTPPIRVRKRRFQHGRYPYGWSTQDFFP